MWPFKLMYLFVTVTSVTLVRGFKSREKNNFCFDCRRTISLKTERFPERQVIMIGTLDDPSQIALSTHMFVEEAFEWVEFPKDHLAYAKHRINEDGTPASPIN